MKGDDAARFCEDILDGMRSSKYKYSDEINHMFRAAVLKHWTNSHGWEELWEK